MTGLQTPPANSDFNSEFSNEVRCGYKGVPVAGEKSNGNIY